jgi:hypothetical protein
MRFLEDALVRRSADLAPFLATMTSSSLAKAATKRTRIRPWSSRFRAVEPFGHDVKQAHAQRTDLLSFGGLLQRASRDKCVQLRCPHKGVGGSLQEASDALMLLFDERTLWTISSSFASRACRVCAMCWPFSSLSWNVPRYDRYEIGSTRWRWNDIGVELCLV